jgi:hypothetical protein
VAADSENVVVVVRVADPDALSVRGERVPDVDTDAVMLALGDVVGDVESERVPDADHEADSERLAEAVVDVEGDAEAEREKVTESVPEVEAVVDRVCVPVADALVDAETVSEVDRVPDSVGCVAVAEKVAERVGGGVTVADTLLEPDTEPVVSLLGLALSDFVALKVADRDGGGDTVTEPVALRVNVPVRVGAGVTVSEPVDVAVADPVAPVPDTEGEGLTVLADAVAVTENDAVADSDAVTDAVCDGVGGGDTEALTEKVAEAVGAGVTVAETVRDAVWVAADGDALRVDELVAGGDTVTDTVSDVDADVDRVLVGPGVTVSETLVVSVTENVSERVTTVALGVPTEMLRVAVAVDVPVGGGETVADCVWDADRVWDALWVTAAVTLTEALWLRVAENVFERETTVAVSVPTETLCELVDVPDGVGGEVTVTDAVLVMVDVLETVSVGLGDTVGEAVGVLVATIVRDSDTLAVCVIVEVFDRR